MKEQEQTGKALRDLINIIHFTERVSTKIHGLRDETEIYKTVMVEFARSKRYTASIVLPTDDRSKLRIIRTSTPSGKLKAGEKVSGFRLKNYSIDLSKSSIYRQVVREGETVQTYIGNIINELFPRPKAWLILKAMGYEKRPTILTPLKQSGKIIGVLAMSSTNLAEYFIPSVRNLAQHISIALETADENTKRKRVEEAVQQSQLLASLGEMTAGIAHEVNNPLGIVLLYSEMLMSSDIPQKAKKDLKIIHNEAKRATRVMTDLLTYSRRLKSQMRRINLHKVLNKVLDMRRYRQKVQNITTITCLKDSPLYVRGDSSQLMQVFMNLVLNAEEALKKSNGGNIAVSTRINGKWAEVSIADDGNGIPKKSLNQVFYPFFSTKEVGEGTGLGLSTCYGIVMAYNGLIQAENNEMGGATFTVQLPLVETHG